MRSLWRRCAPALAPSGLRGGGVLRPWRALAAAPRLGAVASRGLASEAAVPAQLVKELRDRTAASLGKCRQALKEEAGDLDRAVEWLRKRGIKSMERRTADSGEALLALSVSPRGGAIVELRTETDFVTRNDDFQRLALALAGLAGRLGPGTGLAEAPLGDDAGLGKVSCGASVETALLEVGSVLGERLVLGRAEALTAPPDGAISGYVHPKFADSMPGTGRMAALVALRGEGNASGAAGGAAKGLAALADRVARHIVAAQPRFLSIDLVPEDVLKKEQEMARESHLSQLGPEKAAKVTDQVMAKVVEGKTRRFYQESVLLRQEPLVPAGAGEAPIPATVEAWLAAEAATLNLDAIAVDDFRFVSL